MDIKSGKPYPSCSLSKNSKFKKALLDSGDAILTHSIGKRKQKDTILTTS